MSVNISHDHLNSFVSPRGEKQNPFSNMMNVRSINGSPQNFKQQDNLMAPIIGSGRRYSQINKPGALNQSVEV
jgi:hypothetical protein